MMHRTMLVLWWIILLVVVCWVLFVAARSLFLLRQSKLLSQQAVAYRQTGEPHGPNFLIAGDSTGAGVGAQGPQYSVAGRLGQDIPQAHIENISISGLTLHEVYVRLESTDKRYDLLLLQVGANDVVGFTPLSRVHTDAQELLALAKTKAGTVVWMSSGDVGLSPLFPWPLSELWRYRSRVVRGIFLEEASRASVTYVDLYRSKEDEPFLKDVPKYFARDQFHPSAEGYALWYTELKQAANPVLSPYAQNFSRDPQER